jgi:hypothetical protein
MIKYTTHNEIIKSKWDYSITNSVNKLPYAYSWYLDIVSPNWDALIYDDYKVIMPLTKRKKYGISYIYQPILCQQLGAFSTVNENAFCIDDYIKAIPNKFKLIEIAINSKNFLSNDLMVKQTIRKCNQILSLYDNYENIHNGYKKNHKKNIEKFFKHRMSFEIRNQSYQNFCQNKFNFIKEKGIEMKKQDKDIYMKLLMELERRDYLKTYLGYDKNNKILGGISYFNIDESIMIQTFCNKQGRSHGLMYFLMDNLIRENSGKRIFIDFMGSSIEGIRYFHNGFGCHEEYFTFIKINRLNKIMRLIKN